MISVIATKSEASNLLCQEVVNIINEGLIIKSLDGNTVKVNSQGLMITGLKEEDFNDVNLPQLAERFYKPDMSPFKLDEMPSAITRRTGASMKNVVMGFRTDEKMIWLSANSKIFEMSGEQYLLISFFDISDLIESNRRLAEKEEHLKAIVASIDDMVFEISGDGVFLNYWTKDERSMFYPPERFMGKSIAELFPAEEAARYLKLIRRALQTGETQELEYQSQLSADKDKWYKMRINPLTTAIDKVTINISDVTVQRNMKKKLAEMEEMWRFALEGSELGVWIWDVDTDQIVLSEKWIKMLGYEDGKMVSSVEYWKERVHPEDVEGLNEAFAKQLEGAELNFSYEYRLMDNDGIYKWVLSRGMLERGVDGKPIRMIGTHTDITEKVEALEHLRISEQKFHNAFHYSGIGMALVGLDGKCMEVNTTLSNILGYSADEFYTMIFPEYTHPDDVEKDLANMERLVAGFSEHYSIEKRYLHKNGYYVWCLLTVSLVMDYNHHPALAIAQVQDITAIKSMISVLENQNARLELTTLDLEQKINQLEEFNQMVAHNLRGPAANVDMLIEAIESAEDEEEKRNFFELLKCSSAAMQQTLGELMEILEIRMNKTLPSEFCCFCDILKNTLMQYNAIIVQKNAQIVTDFEVGAIQYPRIYMESIFHNLISNALKYSSEDRTPYIRIRSFAEDGNVFLSVSDNGLGIDLVKYGSQMFKFRKIFHPNHDSRGVGLYMTRNQVETMGGVISVSSEPGNGSEFSIRF